MRNQMHARCGPLTDEDGSQFIVLRHLPEGLQIPGCFFPADDAATLTDSGSVLGLIPIGRNAHGRGAEGDSVILHVTPNPALNAKGAINRCFSTEERPWAAEA